MAEDELKPEELTSVLAPRLVSQLERLIAEKRRLEEENGAFKTKEKAWEEERKGMEKKQLELEHKLWRMETGEETLENEIFAALDLKRELEREIGLLKRKEADYQREQETMKVEFARQVGHWRTKVDQLKAVAEKLEVERNDMGQKIISLEEEERVRRREQAGNLESLLKTNELEKTLESVKRELKGAQEKISEMEGRMEQGQLKVGWLKGMINRITNDGGESFEEFLKEGRGGSGDEEENEGQRNSKKRKLSADDDKGEEGIKSPESFSQILEVGSAAERSLTNPVRVGLQTPPTKGAAVPLRVSSAHDQPNSQQSGVPAATPPLRYLCDGEGDCVELPPVKKMTFPPGSPGAPHSIKISQSASVLTITWEPPLNSLLGDISEYTVFVYFNRPVKPPTNAPPEPLDMYFRKVYCGPANQCNVPLPLPLPYLQFQDLGDGTSNYRRLHRIAIAAKNANGYGPVAYAKCLLRIT